MRPAGHRLRRHAALIGLAAAISLSGWLAPAAWDRLDLLWLQWSQEQRGKRAVPPRLAIVAIDDFSLQQAQNSDLSSDPRLQRLGSWPWPRSVYGELATQLFRCGASAVAIDLLFETPSSHGPDDDRRLAEALRRHPGRIVLGAQVLESRGPVAGLSVSEPLAPLRQAVGATGVGLLNGHPDADGTLREWPSLQAARLRNAGLRHTPPSLAVAALRASGASGAATWRPPSGWRPLLDPYGPPRTIPTVSIWALLQPNGAEELCRQGLVRQRLVLVGPTAAVFQDLHLTPWSGQEGMPGVEIHATEIANRLERRPLLFLPHTGLWSALLGAACLGLGLASRRWERPLSRLLWCTAIGLGWVLLGVAAAAQLAIGLRLFSLATVSLLTGVLSSAEATVKLQWQRRRLRQSLERYLSPAIASRIANQPAEADQLLGGQRTDVVVLLTDIRGFTAYTHHMGQAGRSLEVVDRLNQYFSELVSAIHAQGGSVDKFIGDSCLAVFGAPLHRGNHQEAEAALRAALDIQERLHRLNQRWQQQGLEPWHQVIVLSFGPVISGNIGSSSRMDYTVIGDAVNSASRLESFAKSSGQDLVLSSGVADLLDGSWPLLDLGEQELRGQQRQRVFAVESVHGTGGDEDPALKGA
jgi:adenylate cyclase